MLAGLQLGLIHIGQTFCVFITHLNGNSSCEFVGFCGIVRPLHFLLADAKRKDRWKHYLGGRMIFCLKMRKLPKETYILWDGLITFACLMKFSCQIKARHHLRWIQGDCTFPTADSFITISSLFCEYSMVYQQVCVFGRITQ